MSPEMIKRQKVGPPADIWAIGVIAHILLTGCVPFEGETRTEVLKAI